MFLARSNLFHDKIRLALSVVGVALAVMLILILSGLKSGFDTQIGVYLQHQPGSIVMLQQDTGNILSGTSVLPPGSADAARAVPGVATVAPVLGTVDILDLHDEKVFAFLIGYDPALGGGPWRLASGREPQTDQEVVLDRVLARQHAIAVGDSVTILGQPLSVVGLSDGTNSWLFDFLFVRKSAAESLIRAPGATSFLLVTPLAQADPRTVRDSLRAVQGTDALPKRMVIANDQRLFGGVLDPILQLMIGIAFLVGILVVGLLIYTATVERQREYGVLKAVGTRNGLIYRIVAIQALLTTVAGAIVGVGLSFVAARLIMGLRPQFLISFGIASLSTALLVGVVMALLAALFPVRTIGSLAPADVFRR